MPSGRWRTEAEAFVKESRKLSEKRNSIIHGRWIRVRGEGKTLLHYSLSGPAAKRMLPEAQETRAADVLKLGDEIRVQVLSGSAVLDILMRSSGQIPG